MRDPVQDAAEVLAGLFSNGGRLEATGPTEALYRRAMDPEVRMNLDRMCDGMALQLVETPRSLCALATEHARFCLNKYEKERVKLFRDATPEKKVALVYLSWYVLYRLTNPEEIREFIDAETLLRDFTKCVDELSEGQNEESAFAAMTAMWSRLEPGVEADAYAVGLGSLKTKFGCAGRVHKFLREVGLMPEGAFKARDFRASSLLKECWAQALPEGDGDCGRFIELLSQR